MENPHGPPGAGRVVASAPTAGGRGAQWHWSGRSACAWAGATGHARQAWGDAGATKAWPNIDPLCAWVPQSLRGLPTSHLCFTTRLCVRVCACVCPEPFPSPSARRWDSWLTRSQGGVGSAEPRIRPVTKSHLFLLKPGPLSNCRLSLRPRTGAEVLRTVAKGSVPELTRNQAFKYFPLPCSGRQRVKPFPWPAPFGAHGSPFPWERKLPPTLGSVPCSLCVVSASRKAEDAGATGVEVAPNSGGEHGRERPDGPPGGPGQRGPYPAGLPSLQVTDVLSRRCRRRSSLSCCAEQG